MAHELDTCPECGADPPAGANFCARCGHDLRDAAGATFSASSPPRLFGVLSPVAAFALAAVLLAGAIVALFAAGPITSILLFALAGAAFVLFYGAADRDQSSRVGHGAVVAKDRVRGWTSFTAGSAGAWTRAGREVMRLRGELRRLRSERARQQVALGEAAYREDDDSVASLKSTMRALDDEIAQREAARADALARARNRVADERLAVHPTQIVPPHGGDGTSGPAER